MTAALVQYPYASPHPHRLPVCIMTHLHHGRLHRIRSWGLVRASNARLPQRCFTRLTYYTLTVFDSADENASLVILKEILVGAQKLIVNRRREIIIKLHNDRMTVQLCT